MSAPTSSTEIPDTLLMAQFMADLRRIAKEMFTGVRFRPRRAYVNHNVYDGMYYMHRDLSAVTVRYCAT